jgi:hypothetical protein
VKLTDFPATASARQVLLQSDRLQPGQPVVAVSAPGADRPLIVTSLQQRLVKTGRPLIKHARYYWLVLARAT